MKLYNWIKDRMRELMIFSMFWIGYGIALHGIASELYKKGGYPEILSFQGEWIGFTLMAIAFVISLIFWRNKNG